MNLKLLRRELTTDNGTGWQDTEARDFYFWWQQREGIKSGVAFIEQCEPFKTMTDEDLLGLFARWKLEEET